MEGINKEDIEFLDTFFSSEELTDEGLSILDEKLKDPKFKAYYKMRLDQRYSTTPLKIFIAYLPMLIMVLLALIGLYLIFN